MFHIITGLNGVMHVQRVDMKTFNDSLPRVKTIQPSLSKAGCSNCFHLVQEGELIGGYRIVKYKKYVRAMNVFVVDKWQHRGLVPRMLLNIYAYFELPVFIRALKSMRPYWERYGHVTREWKTVVEFHIDILKTDIYMKTYDYRKSRGYT